MPKKVLIINKAQFGYHTDYDKYCEYLRDDFSVTYFCFDSGHKRLEMDSVIVKYVSTKGNRTIRGFRFMLEAIFQILNFKGIIFVHYFESCQFLKYIFPKKKMILDIRTLSINPNAEERMKYDRKLSVATRKFDFTTIISEGLREKLKLKSDQSAILPLGADIISSTNKDFSKEIRLLYVGILNGRNIAQTIVGLSIFLKNNPNIHITYDIVGDGKEIENLKSLVLEESLTHMVKFHGWIPHFQIKPFFDNCTVGISYVPMTEYYENQPVTKTYEYILSGLICIATNTYENKLVVNKKNGVLCNDNPESFAHALEKTFRNRRNYTSSEIRESLQDHTWSEIIKKSLVPLLNGYF